MAVKKDNDRCCGHDLFMFPVFELNRKELENDNISFSRGCGCEFNENSQLPLSALHYKYPKDMWIIEIHHPMFVINVENGMITKTGDIQILNGVVNKPIYDTFGHKLNVYSFADLINLCDDYVRYVNEEITSNAFCSKWFEESNISFVKFGRYIEVFYKVFYSEDSIKETFKKHFKNFIKKNNIKVSEFIYDYYKWVNNDDILPKEDIEIIKDSLED